MVVMIFVRVLQAVNGIPQAVPDDAVGFILPCIEGGTDEGMRGGRCRAAVAVE